MSDKTRNNIQSVKPNATPKALICKLYIQFLKLHDSGMEVHELGRAAGTAAVKEVNNTANEINIHWKS
jgi:hypothetical protein